MDYIYSLDYGLRLYNKARKNNLYVIGFEYNGMIYAHFTTRLPRASLYMDTYNGFIRLDLRVSTRDVWLRSKHTYKACTVNELLTLHDETIHCHSFGEMFERYCTEKVGQTWEKDNVAFYNGCDIEHDGYKVSVKFARNATVARKVALNKIARGEI
jgi:hypothetical protein